jgi:hypothetical protein
MGAGLLPMPGRPKASRQGRGLAGTVIAWTPVGMTPQKPLFRLRDVVPELLPAMGRVRD